MKKLFKIFILLLLFQSLFYANDLESFYHGDVQNSKGYCYPMTFNFKDNNYSFDIINAEKVDIFNIPKESILDEYYEENGTFEIRNENGLEYIFFKAASGHQLMEKTGILNFGKLLYLVMGQKIFINSFFRDREPKDWPFMNNYKISTSSYLTEGKTKYNGQNFYYSNYELTPWVEGVKGNGIGQWIEFNFSSTHDEYCPDCIVDSFLISNGYVNYDKPYLYKANNRVKTLVIQCEERDFKYTVELDDTSSFQLITLPKNLGEGPCTVRFTIGSVYKGDKWDDTVINRIIPISNNYIIN